MLLTDRLAERLGVKVGDRLQLAVLEGERVQREVTVVGLVNDMVGLSAYMDIAAPESPARRGRDHLRRGAEDGSGARRGRPMRGSR